ncbi:SIMPL domain-containing protein [Xanthobacter autotrophicus]|uniref:SIMPL domain-containing protein n=1 Tax=Xanthobacter autotrophicus TaxID=280 RepID=UPI0037294F43
MRLASSGPASALRAPRRAAAGAVMAAMAALLLAGGPAAAAATLTVVGEARVSAPPDVAVLTTGTLTTAKTADDALAANSKAVSDVIAALKAAGIESRDIATANFSVQPQYSMPQQGSREAPKLIGFEVRNSVRITVRDLAKLGPLLDKVVQSGANQASGLAFALAEPGQLDREARAAAVKDAMEQAKLIAAAAGVRLTRITSIQPETQGGFPMPAAPMMMKADAGRMAVPVEAGEIEVRARTVMVYEIEPM